ncbi:MAG TPA: flagellar motor protein MotB [Acetivibrio sp.]|jgi:chemotaxis protein MotB|nr:flagellar motor protein MotB [Clostridium sp.]HOQ38103.1 flagellar motor protein MotB [Acetivibrio sp.]HQA58685.1 flagellar motor protein MotB [Acetivibrio sp.]
MRSKRNIEQEEVSEGAPEWLTTYSDMVTLLLTFFVMLFSMATIDKQKFEQVANSLRAAFMSNNNEGMFDYKEGTEVYSITQSINSGEILEDGDEAFIKGESSVDGNDLGTKGGQAEKLEEFIEQIEKLAEEMELGDYVKVIDEETYLTLRIDSVILFDLGKADIKDSGKETLRKIGNLLKELDKGASVQGHTDNLPINTMLFPTNWELSTKRATNVVLFLIEESGVDPTKLTATGNGEFRPIAPNDTEENRQKNRRIDIVIEK